MDKKTVFLLIAEALLVVILVFVVAMDYEPGGEIETVVVTPSVQEGEPVATHEEEPAEHGEAKPAEEAEHAEAKPAEEAEHAEAKHEEEAEDAEAEEAGPAEEVAEAAEEAAEEVAETAEEVVEKAGKAAAKATGGGDVPDVIPMDNPLYPTHTKPIAQFTHTAHYQDYGIGCGECHHDENGQPLTDLKPGDPVESCAACHSEPGRPPREATTPEAKLAYHMQAMHQNCMTCHKEYNKENNTKDAPATCGACHVAEG
ncbi:MAG: cytochrome c3 family protein [Desulfococcaceae bacterium]